MMRRPKRMLKHFFLLAILAGCPHLWADQSVGFGDISENLFATVQGIREIIHIICIITGTALITGAYFRYLTHRRNPVVAPLSSVFAFLITGIIVICLVFIPIGHG